MNIDLKQYIISVLHFELNLLSEEINGDAIDANKIEVETLLMLNEHYAKNYQTINDLKIIYKAFFKLGN
jgi:hypothetical protein